MSLCSINKFQIFENQITKWVSQIGLIGFSIIAQIWSVGFTTCLEKDWILCIANTDSQLTGKQTVKNVNLLNIIKFCKKYL